MDVFDQNEDRSTRFLIFTLFDIRFLPFLKTLKNQKCPFLSCCCCCCCYWTPPPRGGKLGIPAHRAWNLAARPRQSTSYFPRRGQVLTPQLPGIEPSAGFQSLDSKSGSSAGLSRFELGLPPGGLGPHRPLRLDH